MCPPPSDPIRPLRSISGDLYVGRAELPDRVQRRPRREADDQDDRREQRHSHEDEDRAAATWGPEIDPGTYDDDGRLSTTQPDAAPPNAPHIDTSA